MGVFTKRINVSASETEMVDISEDVQLAVKESWFNNGTATVFVTGSTAAVSTIEFEPGLKKDVKLLLKNLAPQEHPYEHHKTWGCDNGRSHLRATALGPSLTVPFVDKKLTLGTWQQVVLIELDTKKRTRELVVQVVGE